MSYSPTLPRDAVPPPLPAHRPLPVRPLMLLLAAQYVGIGAILPYYAFTQQPSAGLRVFSVALALFALFTIASVWRRWPWAAWATLTLVSFKFTVDLYTWALNLDPLLLPLSQVLNGGVIVLVFWHTAPASATVTVPQRVYYLFVLALAAWVGYWGMFRPEEVDAALPFLTPPLHARFLGAMYLSGVAAMLLAMFARQWFEVRAVTPMIAVWTGTLAVVSLFHLEAFDWSRPQVWFWFVAYIGYALIALWIAWRQRTQIEHSSGPAYSPLLRVYLNVHGVLVTCLAVMLLANPQWMAGVWPWKITPMLAQLYGAPFLSFGVGSLLAARQRAWSEVRTVVYAMLVFTLGVLAASLLHVSLFDFGPASLAWFGGFLAVTLALALFSAVPTLRISADRAGQSTLTRIGNVRIR